VLKFDGEALDPAKPLDAYGIEDEDLLDAVIAKT
jgi:hypothetical protein